jgi:hypothetical protein
VIAAWSASRPARSSPYAQQEDGVEQPDVDPAAEQFALLRRRLQPFLEAAEPPAPSPAQRQIVTS